MSAPCSKSFVSSLQLSLKVLTLLNASLRRKKIQLRALRLMRHQKDAEQNARRDLAGLGVPIYRLGRAMRDPLQLPDMNEPDY